MTCRPSAVVIDQQGNVTVEGNVNAQKYQVDTSNAQSASLGQATLPAGQASVNITTQAVSSHSAVFVTVDGVPDEPLGVSGKVPGTSFTVEFQKPEPTATPSHWWLIN